MTNGEWVIKQGLKFADFGFDFSDPQIIDVFYNGDHIETVDISNNNGIRFNGRAWFDMEHKDQILEKNERKWLCNVIAPFRDKILSIYKGGDEKIIDNRDCGNHWLSIKEKPPLYSASSIIVFPTFYGDEHFAGMETWKEYSIEDLGL